MGISIALDKLANGFTVSTILLENHPGKNRFETLVFDDSEEGREVYGERSPTEEEAVLVHFAKVEEFKAKTSTEFTGYGPGYFAHLQGGQ